ncbi:pollen Ole e I family allergen protein [Rhynchospora pubera]|uniref:Pollen Ole e I family allergen protein n=1 Tax=Rhynchospora pubera TaxID=906938 RepID=A0AAV8H638_9POAL|nr:pollen Ole e I family allergen protein [Rhynchospora pubera]
MSSAATFCLLCCLALWSGAVGFSGGEKKTRTGEIHSKTSEVGWPGYLYTRAEGRCTPQYWSSGSEAWPNIVPKEAAISKVFGSRVLERYEPSLTLLDATQRNDDVGGSAFAKLVKHASAALLNAYARDGFPYDSWEVKVLLLQALVSEEAAAAQAGQFEQANLSCT